jgi:hypothetical protein
MRIISRFKDYYDTALAHGADDKLVYVRQPQEYKQVYENGRWCHVPQELAHLGRFACEYGGKSDVRGPTALGERYAYVYVCGVRYPAVGIGFGTDTRDFTWFYDFETFERGVKVVIKQFIEERSHHAWFRPKVYTDYEANIIKHLDPDRKPSGLRFWRQPTIPFFSRRDDKLKAFCEEHNLPIIIGHSDRVVLNGPLRPMQFIKVMPPATLFQELAMFLGNQASVDDTPVKISDKDRIAQHGFDKFSFRKQPKE